VPLQAATEMSQTDVIHDYRSLYRGLLRAVQFSKPARFTARDQLRRAFRERGARYDAEGIKRTGWFLDAAAREAGLEHKIMKNLLRTQYEREQARENWKVVLQRAKTQAKEYVPLLLNFDSTGSFLPIDSF
jgi:hypothetical protein